MKITKWLYLLLTFVLVACASGKAAEYDYSADDILIVITEAELYTDSKQSNIVTTLAVGEEVIPYPSPGLQCIGSDRDSMFCNVQVVRTFQIGYISEDYLEYPFVLQQQTEEALANLPNEYAQKVHDAIWGCFKSYVYDTDQPDEYESQGGVLIKVIEIEDPRKDSKSLSNADIMNGVLWENSMRMKVVIYNGDDWIDEEIYSADYRYKDDGTVEKYILGGNGLDWVEFGASCRMNNGDASILK